MAYIELKGINAGYVKGSPILNDFKLEVERGELVSLLGPSGCGKTTTLRTISGFISPEKGQVIIDGKDVTKLPPNKRNIGLVFQTYALFPHLNVFENVAYGLKRRKVEKAIIEEKVNNVLALVSLTGFEKRLPANLSGGQRQRVALARSLVIEPDLLLLDEPLSNLDAKLRDEMRAELSRLQHQLGITMIYVTHDQIEALSLSSKIIVMNEGNIEQMGTPKEIYEKPATKFVAKFVGFDNMLNATCVEAINDKEAIVEVDNIPIKITREQYFSLSNLKKGDLVSLFFRAEDTIISDKEIENSLPALLNYANYQGSNSSFALTYKDKEIRSISKNVNLQNQRELYFAIPSDKIIIERR